VQEEYMNAVKPEELDAVLKEVFDKGNLEGISSDSLAQAATAKASTSLFHPMTSLCSLIGPQAVHISRTLGWEIEQRMPSGKRIPSGCNNQHGGIV